MRSHNPDGLAAPVTDSNVSISRLRSRRGAPYRSACARTEVIIRWTRMCGGFCNARITRGKPCCTTMGIWERGLEDVSPRAIHGDAVTGLRRKFDESGDDVVRHAVDAVAGDRRVHVVDAQDRGA